MSLELIKKIRHRKIAPTILKLRRVHNSQKPDFTSERLNEYLLCRYDDSSHKHCTNHGHMRHWWQFFN